MRVDSQRLAIRASSKILVEYSPCPVEAILSAVIAVVTRFRTQKTRKPESTQCVPKKNMKSATGFFLIVLYNLSLILINCVNGTPWQFIFFFGTHCVLSGFLVF